MNPREAYDIICSKYNEQFVVFGCRDYDDFYAFFVAPEGTRPREKICGGSEMMCVNKTTRKVTYEPIYDHFGETFALIDTW